MDFVSILSILPAKAGPLSEEAAPGAPVMGIHRRNKVLRRIEEHYDFRGWAHDVDERWGTPGKNPFDYLVYFYWVILFFGTTRLAWAVWFNSP